MISTSIKKRTVFLHKEFKAEIESKYRQFGQKTDWLISQLILDGRLDKTKGTGTHNQTDLCRWRRNPIRGSKYYLWWVPLGTQGTESLNSLRTEQDEEIFCIRKITHHNSIDHNAPISLGITSDYADNKVDFLNLEPYEDQQAEIVMRPVADFSRNCQIDVVNGNPGSGKTVALKHALRALSLKHFEVGDHTDARFLYITYTSTLKADAEKFCGAYGLDDEVDVVTLDDLIESHLQEEPSDYKTTEESLAEFEYFLKSPEGKQVCQEGLKLWRDYIEDLWIEIRSNIIGMSMPDEWERGDGLKITADAGRKLIIPSSYGKLRHQEKILRKDDLKIAYNLARSIKKDRQIFKSIFPELFDLEKILWSKDPLKTEVKYAALIVDEIQDLTLSQVALIIKIAKETQNPELPYRILLAGDESQTIQPSGFDWNFTKDILRKYFLTDPQKCPLLTEQKRSPYPLNLLIKETRKLYGYIPKQIKPQDQSLDDENINTELEDQQGQLLLCDISTKITQNKIIQDLEKYSGLGFVIIDLFNKVENLSVTNYIAQIKGLEKEYVILFNLDKSIQQLQLNDEKQRNNQVCSLESRRIIDHIRVAVSRSTNTLILLAENPESIEQEFPALPFIKGDWSQVCRILNDAEQGIDSLEKVNNLIGDWKNSIEREDIQAATKLRELLNSDQFHIDDYQISRNIRDQESDYQKLNVKLQQKELNKKIRDEIQGKSINDISNALLQEFNQEISILEDQEKIIFEVVKEKTQEMKFGIEYLLFLKENPKNKVTLENIREIILERQKISMKYMGLEKHKIIQDKIHKTQKNIIDEYRNIAWEYAVNIRKDQSCRLKEWGNYIEAINMMSELSDNEAKENYEYIYRGWKSFYPILNIENIDMLSQKVQCINSHQSSDFLKTRELKIQQKIQRLTTECWISDLLYQLNIILEKSIDEKTKKEILKSSTVINFTQKYIDSNFEKLKHQILSQSRQLLKFEESSELHRQFEEKHPLQEAIVLIENLDHQFEKINIESSEINYFVEKIEKLQSFIKKKNSEN